MSNFKKIRLAVLELWQTDRQTSRSQYNFCSKCRERSRRLKDILYFISFRRHYVILFADQLWRRHKVSASDNVLTIRGRCLFSSVIRIYLKCFHCAEVLRHKCYRNHIATPESGNPHNIPFRESTPLSQIRTNNTKTELGIHFRLCQQKFSIVLNCTENTPKLSVTIH